MTGRRARSIGSFLVALLCLVAFSTFSGRATAQRYEHHTVRIEHGIIRVVPDSRFGAVVEDQRGDYFRVQGWPLTVWPIARPTSPGAAATYRDGMLPDGTISRGARNMRAAWLINPTTRYRHGVLGDAIEAGGLAAEDPVGNVSRYELPDDAVFEDRTARIVDVDGDGRDEILVVKSYLQNGAAVAVFGMVQKKIIPLAESDPIGLSHRWLNPIGAADFDGDGKVEIAVVRTPHIGGILIFYRLDHGKLVEISRYPGFSNHRMGSRDLGLSAIGDLDGDGIADIAVPSANRRVLRLLSFAGGQMREIQRIENTQGEIATDIIAVDLTRNGRLDLAYGVSSGFLTVVFNH